MEKIEMTALKLIVLEVPRAIPGLAQITDRLKRNREFSDRDAWCKVSQALVLSVLTQQDLRRVAIYTIPTGRLTQHLTHTSSEVLI